MNRLALIRQIMQRRLPAMPVHAVIETSIPKLHPLPKIERATIVVDKGKRLSKVVSI